jgi:putative redox protein
MATTTVRFLDGVRFEAEARGHKVLCDQPTDNGGADSGMTPPEFLLSSLGTCAAYYALQYLKTRNLSTHGLTVKVEAGKAAHPARLDNFHILIDVPGLEDPRHREGVVRAAKNCLIHNTMLHTPSIEIGLDGNAVIAADLKTA